MTAAAGARPAGLARRLAASAYEAMLLAALLIAAGFALLPFVTPPWAAAPGTDAGARAGATLYQMTHAARVGSALVLFAVCAAYCVGLWSGGRRTLPMKTWRLELRTAAGHNVDPSTALLRYLACWIGPVLALAAAAALQPGGHGRWGLLLLGVTYAWALVDRERQFLQDRLAGTRLVAAGPGRE